MFFETYNYDVCFENEESTNTTRKSDKKESTNAIRKSDKEESTDKEELIDKRESVDLFDMPALKGDEVEEGKRLKILTTNKLLTVLPMLLAQIKAGTIHTN